LHGVIKRGIDIGVESEEGPLDFLECLSLKILEQIQLPEPRLKWPHI